MVKKTSFYAMFRLGIILAAYSAAACVGLAFVYSATGEIIIHRRKADLEAGLRELFPDADSFRTINDIKSFDPMVTIGIENEDPDNSGAFAAVKNNSIIGVILRTSRASFNGPVILLVGVGVDRRIKGVKILEHSDTPGLGANAASGTYYVDRPNRIRFLDQFKNKSVADAFLPKQDVAAITSATVTSAAICASVKAAGEAAVIWMAANGEAR